MVLKSNKEKDEVSRKGKNNKLKYTENWREGKRNINRTCGQSGQEKMMEIKENKQ